MKILKILIRRIKEKAIEYLTWCKDYVIYLDHRISHKPYFGNIMASHQINESRREAMINLFFNKTATSNRDFKILEIGSWAGESAYLWAGLCGFYCNGKVYCVDSWKPFETQGNKVMARALKRNKIFKHFLRNVEYGGYEDRITVLKGSSNDILPILKQEFDFIYIDGDHSYEQCKKDIENSLKILKVGGILCGDDYGQEGGVTKAVNELLPNFKDINGFWYVS